MKRGGLKDEKNLIMYSTLIAAPPVGAIMARRSDLDKRDKSLLCLGAGIMTTALILGVGIRLAPVQINMAAEIPQETTLQVVDESQFLTVERPQYGNVTAVANVDEYVNLEKDFCTATY